MRWVTWQDAAFMIQTGYFILTDLAGYTAYLTASELDHAQDILRTIFDKQLEQIKPPLVLSNFQGDAILSYIPNGSLIQGQTLLELIEAIYFSFAETLEQIQYNSTCTCNACKNAQTLGLKIFVHYGDYLLHTVGEREELMGQDVILAHRMMKNQVKAQTGMSSYALLTEAAIQQMGIEALCAGMTPYLDRYDHLGEVKMVAHSLEAAWTRERQARHFTVRREDAWLAFETALSVPCALVWDYLTHPEHKAEWMQMNAVTRSTPLGERTGIGSSYHCAHEAGDLWYKIVDWHPFEHFTAEEVGLADLRYRKTYQLTETREGCLLRAYFGAPDNEPGLVAQMTPIYQQALSAMIANLPKVIEADLAAGKIVAASRSG